MVDGESALWQVQTSAVDGTEATALAADVGFVIVFNETPINTSDQLIKASECSIRDSIPEVPRVFADGNEVQDMGLDGVNIRLSGLIRNANDISPGGTPAQSTLNKLMTWKRQAQTVTDYTQGRFGLRLNDFPAFNTVPTDTFGGKLQDLTFVRDPEELNAVRFDLTFRVGGNITSWFLSNGF